MNQMNYFPLLPAWVPRSGIIEWIPSMSAFTRVHSPG
jgi:hypothetical protein